MPSPARLFPVILLLAACSEPTAPDVSFSRHATVDLFVVAGQSNARGPTGLNDYAYLREQYRSNRILGMTAWGAFGVAYRATTGRNVAIVNTRSGGGSQTAEANPTLANKNWDTTGFLVPASIKTADSVLALGGYDLKGIIWSQGESDSRFIQSRSITPQRYKQALQAMIGRYRAHYGPTIPFYIIRTGRSTLGDDYGWRAVRRMQEDVAAADPYTHIAYRGTLNFPAQGLMHNENHYSTEGYRRVGRAAARYIANN